MFDKIIAWFTALWIAIISILVQWGWVPLRWGLLPNEITAGPAVFVGEDEYQIIWETQQPSIAWVIVGGKTYTDNNAGNLIWDDTMHKVAVPMEALDAARGYEIHWQHTLRLKDAKSLERGIHKAKEFDFRPIDTSDGIQIYHLSDTHTNMQPGAQTAQYWGDKLDLLILNGDIIHNPHTASQRIFALRLATEITQGRVPVLFARGNHETRGMEANNLQRSVGGPGGGRWYYTTRIGQIWVAVFDMGEDKLDDHEEYDGLADYADYRERESKFFERVIANASTEFNAPGVEYRLLISHIPVGYNSVFRDAQARFAGLANQMDLDLALSGHTHTVNYYPPGAYNGAGVALNYPLLIASRPAHSYEDGIFIAGAVELKDGGIKGWFTNQSHEILQEVVVR